MSGVRGVVVAAAAGRAEVSPGRRAFAQRKNNAEVQAGNEELALGALATANELDLNIRRAGAGCRAVEVEVERDEYVVALEAAKKQGKNQFKQLKKLRQLVQRIPPSHPSRPDALLQLSLSILDLHDSSQHKTEAYELGIAAVEAAPEGSRVWVQAMCMAWQDCQHTVVQQADRPSWWTVDELHRRAKLCCRADGMAALAWIFQGDMLDGSSRTALPRGLTFDRIPTSAEKRAAAMCYTKAAMVADGPETYLTHPSSLGAKMQRMAARLQDIVKTMEDPERGESARATLQEMLDTRNEELATWTDNRDAVAYLERLSVEAESD